MKRREPQDLYTSAGDNVCQLNARAQIADYT
jgi:hypothetical protein